MELVTREIEVTMEELKDKFDIPQESEISDMQVWFDYRGADDPVKVRLVYKELIEDGN